MSKRIFAITILRAIVHIKTFLKFNYLIRIMEKIRLKNMHNSQWPIILNLIPRILWYYVEKKWKIKVFLAVGPRKK